MNPVHKVIVLAVDQLLILIAYSSQSINVAGFVNVKLALGSFTNVLIPSSISQLDTVLVTQDLFTQPQHSFQLVPSYDFNTSFVVSYHTIHSVGDDGAVADF
mgnify:CR=1 FL=1